MNQDNNAETKRDSNEGKETARLKRKVSQKLNEETIDIVEDTKNRIYNNFVALLGEKKLRNVDVLNELSPIITEEPQISKLLKRKLNFSIEVLVALHYVFNVDLNDFIAGDKDFLSKRSDKQEEILDKFSELIEQWKALE